MHPLCCACIRDWSLELALTPSLAAAPAALSPVPMELVGGKGMRPVSASTPMLWGASQNTDRLQGLVRGSSFLFFLPTLPFVPDRTPLGVLVIGDGTRHQ